MAKVSVEVPLEAMEAGRKVVVTPVGSVEVERSTVPEKPLRADTVTVVVADVPMGMTVEAGERVRLKEGARTVSLSVAVFVVSPDAPETVMV